MSLHIAVDGILGTHVFWEDIETEMQRALNTKSKFGEAKTVQNIGDMKGFMSRIGLVEAFWQGEDAEKLPAKFVIKIASQLAMSEIHEKMSQVFDHEPLSKEQIDAFAQITRETHNREVAAYKLLQREKDPNIPIPTIYATRSFSDSNQLQGFLVMNYFDNLYPVPAYEIISSEELRPMLRAAAALSAMGVRLPAEDFSFAETRDFACLFMDTFFDETRVESTKAVIKKLLPDENAEMTDEACELLDFYSNPGFYRKLAEAYEYLGFEKVITHSDLWSGNMLMTKNDGRLHLEALIDWQIVTRGTPAQDMCRLLISCMAGKERRENWESLLEMFYGFLLEDIPEGKKAPYTLEQLKESYLLLFPISVFMVMPAIGSMLQLAGQQIEESKRQQIVAVATEKTLCLTEDLIEVPMDILEFSILFFTVFGTFGNLNIIVATSSSKLLRHRCGYLLVILAFCDTICLWNEFASLIRLTFGWESMSLRRCFFTNIIYVYIEPFEVHLIFAIAFDRLYAMHFGTSYLGLSEEIVNFCVLPFAMPELVSYVWNQYNLWMAVATLLLHSFTYCTVYCFKKKSQSSGSESLVVTQKAILNTVIIQALVFCGSSVLSAALIAVLGLFEKPPVDPELVSTYAVIPGLLSYSGNFYIYFWRSRDYRHQFMRQLGCGKFLPQEQSLVFVSSIRSKTSSQH
ncbi:unnamed protein product [Caenorhabditis auriculariae]|uniref:G-protein coupled receptors family 1 profile domain-containing protein n=1 Tax=Caenorhabditis auriculariae TaxID=2777116 RepID=A0A8S1HF95_9PELO|nr:unnamed protein product [Caenorhabditis auriculariae]